MFELATVCHLVNLADKMVEVDIGHRFKVNDQLVTIELKLDVDDYKGHLTVFNDSLNVEYSFTFNIRLLAHLVQLVLETQSNTRLELKECEKSSLKAIRNLPLKLDPELAVHRAEAVPCLRW